MFALPLGRRGKCTVPSTFTELKLESTIRVNYDGFSFDLTEQARLFDPHLRWVFRERRFAVSVQDAPLDVHNR